MKTWILEETEHWCGDAGAFTSTVAIFQDKPDIKTLAPYLNGLHEDFVEAVKECEKLISEGYVEMSDIFCYSLYPKNVTKV